MKIFFSEKWSIAELKKFHGLHDDLKLYVNWLTPGRYRQTKKTKSLSKCSSKILYFSFRGGLSDRDLWLSLRAGIEGENARRAKWSDTMVSGYRLGCHGSINYW